MGEWSWTLRREADEGFGISRSVEVQVEKYSAVR